LSCTLPEIMDHQQPNAILSELDVIRERIANTERILKEVKLLSEATTTTSTFPNLFTTKLVTKDANDERSATHNSPSSSNSSSLSSSSSTSSASSSEPIVEQSKDNNSVDGNYDSNTDSSRSSDKDDSSSGASCSSDSASSSTSAAEAKNEHEPPTKKIKTSHDDSPERMSVPGLVISSRTGNSEASAPSITANVSNGRSNFDQRCRSVLSHPFALLLVFVLNQKEILDIINTFISEEGRRAEYLNTDTDNILKQVFNSSDCSSTVTEVFQQSVTDTSNTTEKKITKSAVELLKELETLPFEVEGEQHVKSEEVGQENLKAMAKAFIDIVVKEKTTAQKSYTPLMIMEVGMNHSEWWKKVDQCIKNLNMMAAPAHDSKVRFDKPLLMAVATINRVERNGSYDANNVTVLMALFFCRPKNDKSKFRMTLLWHSEGSCDLFGKLFMDVSKFQHLVKKYKENEELLTDLFQYQYFSSNCCKIGDKVSLWMRFLCGCVPLHFCFCKNTSCLRC
jgi:hypothetical protein